mmetsp:Transcript_26124/g.71648  ORF Transcript_26124/g.71648 Transcript_26124/m.71648 type:complete len:491 (-) Transcript_26124:353-1825(-)
MALSSKEVLSLVLLGLLALLVPTAVNAGAVLGKKRLEKENPTSRGISIDNQSGRKIDLYWVNTFKDPEQFVPQLLEDGKQVGCAYGAEKYVSSFIGHVFEIRELPSRKTKECLFGECRKGRFQVVDVRDQKWVINRDFTVTLEDERSKAFSKADDMFSRCQEQVQAENVDPIQSIELITKCMQSEVDTEFDTDRKERSFQTKIQRDIALDLVSFECGDVNKTESLEIINTTWTYKSSNGDDDDDDNDNDIPQNHVVRLLHQYQTSQIISVENFVSKETCGAMKALREKTPEGTVGIMTEATNEDNDDAVLVDALFYKLYDLLDQHFSHWGETKFLGETLFEYFKDSDGVSLPHMKCIGAEEVAEAFGAIEAGTPQQCQIPGGDAIRVPTTRVVLDDGDPEYPHRRPVAKAFVFCDEPEQKLGGIHFPFAAVHVTPKAGKLVVAVHRHANDQSPSPSPSPELDDFVNEYHFCPNHDVFTHTVSHNRPEGIP